MIDKFTTCEDFYNYMYDRIVKKDNPFAIREDYNKYYNFQLLEYTKPEKYRKNSKEFGTLNNLITNALKDATVENLIEFLQLTADPKAKVVVAIYESCMTDAGTDLGSEEEFPVEITNLGSRVVIKKSHF